MHSVVGIKIDDVVVGKVGEVGAILVHPPTLVVGDDELDAPLQRGDGLEEWDEHVGVVVEAVPAVSAGGEEDADDTVVDCTSEGGFFLARAKVEWSDFGHGGEVVFARVRFHLPGTFPIGAGCGRRRSDERNRGKIVADDSDVAFHVADIDSETGAITHWFILNCPISIYNTVKFTKFQTFCPFTFNYCTCLDDTMHPIICMITEERLRSLVY